ncbi:hypothetical protein [Nonomuraea lactucae]|uniref:hypothetical protein n=1 Tax=Nonomuraea lactucae TaxID=2249762 RepID=UPI000DE357F3|nr:hypothetical protein [Nonomuraea lactucae]
MRTVTRTALAVVAAAGIAMSAATSTANAAAAGTYTLTINTYGVGFVADYCLLSGTGFKTNVKAQCSGNKGVTKFSITVSHDPGDMVWLDINVVGSTDYKHNIIRLDILRANMCDIYGPVAKKPTMNCT